MILGITPARGGSKGVPGKNIRMIAGKPLIAWTIETARACEALDHFIVSTDSHEIADIAKTWGADVPFLRPAELAQDTSPMMPVLEHAALAAEKHFGKKIEFIILLDPTGPLRTKEDIQTVVNLLKTGECDAVLSASRAHRNPWFNMVKQNGPFVELVISSSSPPQRRQDCPDVFDLNTVIWGFTRNAVLYGKNRIPRRSKMHIIPQERAIDLDTEADFKILEFFLKERN